MPEPINPEKEKRIEVLRIEDFAKEIGLEPDEQGRFTFLPEHNELAFRYAENFTRERNTQGIVIDGVASPGVIASLLHGAHPAEGYLLSFNKDTGESNRIKILEPLPQKEGFGPDYLNWHKEEKEEYTLVEFNLSSNFNLEDLSKVIPPEINPTKPVLISGRGPLYLTHTIAAAYRHYKGVPAVGFYQPASKFGPAKTEIGISHSDEYPLGMNFGAPEEIGKAKEIYKEKMENKIKNLMEKIREVGIEYFDVQGDYLKIRTKDGKNYSILIKNIIEE
jgi:hypothetical protein